MPASLTSGNAQTARFLTCREFRPRGRGYDGRNEPLREEALVNISEAIALCLESGDKPSGELVDVTVAG